MNFCAIKNMITKTIKWISIVSLSLSALIYYVYWFSNICPWVNGVEELVSSPDYFLGFIISVIVPLFSILGLILFYIIIERWYKSEVKACNRIPYCREKVSQKKKR